MVWEMKGHTLGGRPTQTSTYSIQFRVDEDKKVEAWHRKGNRTKSQIHTLKRRPKKGMGDKKCRNWSQSIRKRGKKKKLTPHGRGGSKKKSGGLREGPSSLTLAIVFQRKVNKKRNLKRGRERKLGAEG